MSRIHKVFVENEAALRRLLARYLPRQHDIEDLTQETFLHAFAAESDHSIRAPKAYLFRVAKNLALNLLARKSVTTTDFIEDFESSEVLTDEKQAAVDVQVSDRQQLLILSEVVMTLPPQCQRAFMLRKVDGLSYREIAQRMNLSESTVEKHVATGLVKCMDGLRQKGHDPADFGARRGRQDKAEILSIMQKKNDDG